jgi:uncharacterized OB-fold protein
MNAYGKPLPDVQNATTAPFWAGTRSSQLLVQKCADCTYLRWPPGSVCPECLSWKSDWVPVMSTGTLSTFCVYHRAFSPAFADDVPYAVGYVQLDDGPRMLGSMVGELDGLEIGRPVHAVFDAVTTEVTLVRWAMSLSTNPDQQDSST